METRLAVIMVVLDVTTAFEPFRDRLDLIYPPDLIANAAYSYMTLTEVPGK